MSTFDPGFDPPDPYNAPGDWQQGHPSHQDYQSNQSFGRAAVWVWVCAGIELLMSTCCTCSGLVLALVPKEEILKNIPADAPNREQVVQMVPMFTTIGIGLLVLGLILMLPAIVMCFLAFRVRSTSRPSAITCMVLLGIQGLVFSLMLLLMIVVSLKQGMTPDVVGIVIYLGLVVLIGKTLHTLWTALQEQAGNDTLTGTWPS